MCVQVFPLSVFHSFVREHLTADNDFLPRLVSSLAVHFSYETQNKMRDTKREGGRERERLPHRKRKTFEKRKKNLRHVFALFELLDC